MGNAVLGIIVLAVEGQNDVPVIPVKGNTICSFGAFAGSKPAGQEESFSLSVMC